MSLTASVKKLLCSLMLQQQILLYLLPDGSSVNRLQLLSVSIFGFLCRHFTSSEFVTHMTDGCRCLHGYFSRL